MMRLWKEFKTGPTSIKIAATVVVAVWIITLATLIGGAVLLWEQPGKAQPSVAEVNIPEIALQPVAGPVDTPVTINGQGWPPGSTVLIYLATPGEAETAGYAVTSALADPEGRFVATVIIPADSRWETSGPIAVTARVVDGEAGAQALFNVISPPSLPTETSPPPVEPSLPSPEPTVTPTTALQPPTPTSTLLQASVTAGALNVRQGPDTQYPVITTLPGGTTVTVIGQNQAGTWLEVRLADGIVGWLSRSYTDFQGTAPVVTEITSPPTATPLPTANPTATPPPAITDWRGEYFNNLSLSGAPVAVRNDISVDFDWGTGAPVVGVGADNFSVRWTRSLYFPASTYRFYVRVDDGVRLWQDGNLVIDQWHDGAATTYTVDVTLTEGTHNLKMEYYEHTGTALAQLAWARLTNYPDWKGEYYNNPSLSGAPALVRNDVAIDFDWGSGSPASGLPADNFSARWTRIWNVSQAGLYRFQLVADDGVRLWVDDSLIIDQWRDGVGEVSVDYWLNAGAHSMRLEYYEHTGDARILLWAAEVPTAPKADFDASPRSGSAPLRVEFDNHSSGNYDSCEWTFGDGHSSNNCDDPSHTYLEPGDYTVKLTVSGPGGEDSERKSEYITVFYQPVQANFSASPTSGMAPLTVNFSNVSTGDYDTCSWSLGDGSTHTGCDGFSHAYQSEGTYTVGLTVSGPGGSDTETKTNYIAVIQEPPLNQPPTAVINGPTTGLVGELLTFDGGSSSDPDGAILSYTWDFGDGTTASGANVSHSYGQAGSYNVILTVTDDGGLRDTSTYTLLIEESVIDQPPVAVINGPASAVVGETVIFDSGGSHDPDGPIVSYVWDFGDSGSSELAELTQSGESTMAHVYNALGTYQVTLTVTDNGGLSDTAVHTIVVEQVIPNQPPVAVINGPASAGVGETVIFDSSGSHDPDGLIVSYVWDFGDSGPPALTQSGASTMAHVYNASGTYQVTLTVTDEGGLSDTARHIIVIEEPVLNQPPQAVINGPTKGLIGEGLTWDGSSSTDPDGTILSYAWDFGDGAEASGLNVSHSYNGAGNYKVILTVTDDGGLSDSSTYTLLIETPPTPALKAPIPTQEPLKVKPEPATAIDQ